MKIYSYILKAHFAPFILSFVIVIFVFTFQFIMRFIDNLVGKGLSWWVIAQLISLNMAWMVTLAVPMATLVAVLMAFGSLTSNNEITIMKACGISLHRMMIPVLIAFGIICYGLILFNNKVLPEANHRTKVLMTDIQRTKPTFVLEPGRFSEDISGYNILVRKTFPGSNDLEGILVIDNSNAAFSSFLTAEKGSITFTKDFSKVIMVLFNGEIHRMSKKEPFTDYRKVVFEKHVVTIGAVGFGFSESDRGSMSRGDRELSSDSMRSIVNNIRNLFDFDKKRLEENLLKIPSDFTKLEFDTVKLSSDSLLRKTNRQNAEVLLNTYKAVSSHIKNLKSRQLADQKQIDMYLVEIYKKYSIPFACIVFVLIGAPLGVITRKGSFGIAAGMSLGFFLLYWACLIGGEKLADREFVSPFMSMWSANIIIGIAGLYLTIRQSLNFRFTKLFSFLKK